ncbi:MAG: ABC transporter permease subunit [Acidobacteria bacterium]|nr:ABC transporter permease subunit [Acidobacteriota bacterium]
MEDFPNSDLKIIAIALNTFRESVRDRVLYNLVLFVVLIVAAASVIGRIAVGLEAKIIVDVGLSATSVFGLLIAIFIGIGLVSKEIEKRTVAVILSKPVRRSQFILGKYFGLCLTLLVNTAAMAAAVMLALIFSKGGFDSAQLVLWPAAYLIFLELSVMTAVALLFSCFSSPALSALFTLLIFLIGRWSPDLKLFAETADSEMTRIICRALYHLMPNLAGFNFINEAAYGESVPLRLLAGNTVYAVCYIAALLAAAVLIFGRRSFK